MDAADLAGANLLVPIGGRSPVLPTTLGRLDERFTSVAQRLGRLDERYNDHAQSQCGWAEATPTLTASEPMNSTEPSQRRDASCCGVSSAAKAGSAS